MSYQPPYTIAQTILKQVAEIAADLGRVSGAIESAVAKLMQQTGWSAMGLKSVDTDRFWWGLSNTLKR